MASLPLFTVATAHAASIFPRLPTGSVNDSASTGVTSLFNRLLDLLTFLAYPLALAAIIYTAYLLITSYGSPDGYTKAKKNLVYGVTGIGLIMGAVILVNILIGFIQP